MNKQPNHICKYSKCQKEYYACPDCDKTSSWRAVACSPEHYQEYIKEVLEVRNKKNGIKEPIEPKKDIQQELSTEDLQIVEKSENINKDIKVKNNMKFSKEKRKH